MSFAFVGCYSPLLKHNDLLIAAEFMLGMRGLRMSLSCACKRRLEAADDLAVTAFQVRNPHRHYQVYYPVLWCEAQQRALHTLLSDLGQSLLEIPMLRREGGVTWWKLLDVLSFIPCRAYTMNWLIGDMHSQANVLAQ